LAQDCFAHRHPHPCCLCFRDMPTPLRCDSELLGKDLSGKVAIVTGANSGAGYATAQQLALQHASVILACRNKEAGENAAAEVKGTFMELDLSSLQSVRSFVQAFLSRYHRLDFLVNNAGVMMTPEGKTKDNFETQFGTNHLGHFLLTSLLKDILERSAPSRVVCVSSVAAAEMSLAPGIAYIDFDDLNWVTRDYDSGAAYGQSKLANVFHAQEIAKRYRGVIAASVHPGWVDSNLGRHSVGDGCAKWLVQKIFRDCTGDMISPEDGAMTSLYCCLADNIENGAFYSQFGIYKDKTSKAGGWPMKLPNPNDTPENSARLWDESEKLVGLK